MKNIIIGLLLLTGLPMLGESSAANHDDTENQGWISSIQYAPDTSLVYSLGNMRDGKSIRVFLGTVEGSSQVKVNGERHAIKIRKLLKKDVKQGLYEYQFGKFFTGVTRISKKNTWEFRVERTITALHDMKFSWVENYLNSHLIAGRSFSEGPAGKSIPIPKQAIAAKKIFAAWGNVNRFKDIRIDSAIGRIDLKFDRPTLFLDYRQVPWRVWDDAHLIHSDLLLKKGQSLTSVTEVKITPDFKGLASYQPIASKKDVYTSKSPLPSRHVIMPIPKNVDWKKGHFQLQNKAQLFHSPAIKKYVERAEVFFNDKFQISLQGKSLDQRWKHCLVLCNEDLPETLESDLKMMSESLRESKAEGSYALQITDNAVLIVGKSDDSAWNGLMTLFQLSRHQVSSQGISFDQVDILDQPSFRKRGIYVRMSSGLDMKWSRDFVASMAELKYNQVYLHFAQGIGVRFRSQEASYNHDQPSLSTEEFSEFVNYIKSFNMEIIPIWAAGKTMLPKDHFQKYPKLAELTINEGLNWDISLDETFEYHKSLLDEIIQLTGAKTVHLGLDEIYHFALACRKNTGKGDIILSEYINRFTDYYAPLGIRTIVYHDMLLKREDVEKPEAGHFAANGHEGSEKALDLLRNREMLTIEDWSYSANDIYSDFDYFFSKGFTTYGSSWFRYKNIRALSAYTQGRSDTFVCTYWGRPRQGLERNWDPRGNRRLNGRYMTYMFLPAMGLAGEAAWNANENDLPYNFQHETLLLFNQRIGLAPTEQHCQSIDLSGLVNRDIADVAPGDGTGFIDQGRIMDLNTFPSGKQKFGGIPFLIAENKIHQARAISVKASYTNTLPETVLIPIQKQHYTSLFFLHTCHFDFESGMNKTLKTHYLVTYEDGSSSKIPLTNDKNIMAWAPSLTRFDPDNKRLWLAWTGTTEDGLPSSVYAYQWINPQPEKAIISVALQSGDRSNASVFLLGLSGIKP